MPTPTPPKRHSHSRLVVAKSNQTKLKVDPFRFLTESQWKELKEGEMGIVFQFATPHFWQKESQFTIPDFEESNDLSTNLTLPSSPLYLWGKSQTYPDHSRTMGTPSESSPATQSRRASRTWRRPMCDSVSLRMEFLVSFRCLCHIYKKYCL